MTEFILGIVFIALGIPILQNLADCVQSLFQWFCAWCNIHTVKYNTEINKFAQNNIQSEELKTNAIGFGVQNEEEYEDDE